jgi:hypothetical protein
MALTEGFRSPLVGLLLFSFSGAYGHDRPQPNDPSIRFERVLADAVRNLEQHEQSAVLMREVVVSARSIYASAAVWTTTLLRVCFWNGTLATKTAVEASSSIWNGRSRINLAFRTAGGAFRDCKMEPVAEIRVSLDGSDKAPRYEAGQNPSGNWSLVGRQSTFTPYGRPEGSRYDVTMNLPYVDSDLKIGDLVTLNFTVRHEFGHALGLLHEFQSVRCTGWIDFDQLAKDQGWDKETAFYNLAPLPDVAEKYRIAFGQIGDYDVDSVMQYNFLAKYYVQQPGKLNPCERKRDVHTPSARDFETLVAIYGRPSDTEPTPAQALVNRAYELRKRIPAARAFANSTNAGDSEAIDGLVRDLAVLDDFVSGKRARQPAP